MLILNFKNFFVQLVGDPSEFGVPIPLNPVRIGAPPKPPSEIGAPPLNPSQNSEHPPKKAPPPYRLPVYVP